MATARKKEGSKPGHYTGAVQDSRVNWPLLGVRSGSQYNRKTKVPVVKRHTTPPLV